MNSARKTANDILLKIQRDKAYSNLSLDATLQMTRLDQKESAFVSALVYGTLERLITIDYTLSLYLTAPIKKLKPETLTALRLGVCQLLFMDKIPVSAAINESVKLVKSGPFAYSAGIVNAVLRKVATQGLRLPDKADGSFYYSVRYSCPVWLVDLWISTYGEDDACGIMEASLEKAPVHIRVNTNRVTREQLQAVLLDEGVETNCVEHLRDALTIKNPAGIEHMAAYKAGLFHVQDISSQLCCAALSAQNGNTIFDLCAAPGGKAFTLAQLAGSRSVVHAFDIYESRLALIQSGARRLGLNTLSFRVADAAQHHEEFGKADRVLCDVPCSGLGILRRKPEIRYKEPADIDKLPELQYFILCNASSYVKKGGLLVYSTCTLNPSENEDVCNRFLKEHPKFKSLPVFPDFPNRYKSSDFLTLMPHRHKSDGFFIALFTGTE
jgi:16S rRNA (cytosine967-C5)-methyltransferase